MQAVEGVVARHIDGLHDHPGLFGMVGAYVFHAPCFDVQYLPDLMGNHVLIVHFRQGFAVVHGVHVRVDHHLPCQRLPQRRAALFVPQELPDRTRFVHRVHLAGDGGVACFADRVGVGAVSLALVKILQGHGGCFEGLQCRTRRRRRADCRPLRIGHRGNHRRCFGGGLFGNGGSFQRQPPQGDHLNGTGNEGLQGLLPMVVLQCFGGRLEVFEALPQKRHAGEFARQQANPPFDASAEQVFYRLPVRLTAGLGLAVEHLRQQVGVVAEHLAQKVARQGG